MKKGVLKIKKYFYRPCVQEVPGFLPSVPQWIDLPVYSTRGHPNTTQCTEVFYP